MPKGNFAVVTLPKDIVEEAKRFLNEYREPLRQFGIKSISHIFERAYLEYRGFLLDVASGNVNGELYKILKERRERKSEP